MKPWSNFPTLTTVAAASFTCLALVSTIPEAQAGKGISAVATTAGSKINLRGRRGAVPKLTCIGSYCPRRPKENVQTTGSNKANPGVIVRVHGDPNNNASPEGGVRVTDKPRPTPLCAGWGCPRH